MRRARRVLWSVRLVFYPAAIGVAALLLAARGGEVNRYLDGTTSQREAIFFNLDGDDEVTYFEADITATCLGGEKWRVRWWEAERLATSFHQDGSRLEIDASEPMRYSDSQTGLREFALRAHVDDDRAAGELTFVERLVAADGRRYECASGKVTFTAQR